MTLFLVGLGILVVGYFTYGRLVERVFAPDDRETPALTMADGVDYVAMPQWKNMLIQLLNIAGSGPVIGVILGIKFGPIAFLLIPIGNILGGSVHDFTSGMISLRNGGMNLPGQIRGTLGQTFYPIFALFMCFLLLLLVTVFVNVPSDLICESFIEKDTLSLGNFGDVGTFWFVVTIIFAYYIAAALFPIDKIIGRFYPFFGGLLLVGTGLLFVSLICASFQEPRLLTETEAIREVIPKQGPIVPCLFVTIACGILSGFHATQSPIVARTLKSERQARATFYGMMVLEGVIAMIWAAGALAVYHLFPEFLVAMPTDTLDKIASHFLGSWVGDITVFAVIVLAVTSGDTALRSLRLSLGEILGVNQKKVVARVLMSLPLILAVSALLAWSNADNEAFGTLWNYFACGNQTLAATTLLACSVYLRRHGKCCWITLLPGAFMTFVVTSFILWTSKEHANGPLGFGLEIQTAYAIAAAATCAVCFWAWRLGRKDPGTLV